MKKILFFLFVGLLGACKNDKPAESAQNEADFEQAPATFSGDSAFAHVEKQCAFGARVPGSKAHADCAAYLAAQFRALGLNVEEQRANITAWDGKTLGCVNIKAAYKPEAAERILLCAHWDSRPWADQEADASKRREPVMAANDGASGTAVMLEVARHLGELNPSVGVDFVCFDLEDYGAPDGESSIGDGSDWCLGSQYFARHKAADYKPRYGILLDMVGGRDAQFRHEGYSLHYAQGVVAKVWNTADKLGYSKYFVPQSGGYITDDHVPLNQAGLPTIDIVSHNGETFSSTWHTTKDTPENISKDVLKAVGQTLLQVIFEEK